jgi:hypothetical protein
MVEAPGERSLDEPAFGVDEADPRFGVDATDACNRRPRCRGSRRHVVASIGGCRERQLVVIAAGEHPRELLVRPREVAC